MPTEPIAPLRGDRAICRAMHCALPHEDWSPEPPLRPHGFGVNLNDALINPPGGGADEAKRRRQVAVALHDTRAMGATDVRWFVSTVWPQYRCTVDPEDQATGRMTPASRSSRVPSLRGRQQTT